MSEENSKILQVNLHSFLLHNVFTFKQFLPVSEEDTPWAYLKQIKFNQYSVRNKKTEIIHFTLQNLNRVINFFYNSNPIICFFLSFVVYSTEKGMEHCQLTHHKRTPTRKYIMSSLVIKLKGLGNMRS